MYSMISAQQARAFSQMHQYIPCLWPYTWSQGRGGGRNRERNL